ncbi:outer membrane protein assembly factor BamE [Sphingomonas sp. KR1UV-12]|uniref:Outer membrane protein assembly factor BamE n=1 Tax=Sphingomonas aurea TaxID=3063994 RepID=A0ABT9ENR6_9SPHN|nr:outer membrane protein assembly factor BamE [Sphingomonas sp. KR1UV-12]MDP1028602.1 outer membrane protein assembly factor BamE [Sphingomonas sp. KR1UV-12]
MSSLPVRVAVTASLVAGLLATGCTPLRSHQGYVIDADLVNSVQPGVDNRQSVQQVLGQPTIASQFGAGDWYYVSRDSRNYGFQTPKVRDQTTIQISFDKAGTVTAIRRGGMAQVAAISPYGKKTPTLGRQRGFFEDLFGNIGTVGAAGGMGGSTGGNRDTP